MQTVGTSEPMKPEAWPAVMEGMVRGLETLAGMGALSPKEVVGEARRLMEHPKGCPDDLRERLELLRRRASAQLA